MSSKSRIHDLSEDLLVRVYDRISSDSDTKSWRLVCKDFYRVDSLSRVRIRILRLEFLPVLIRKYSSITSLDLSVCPRIDDGTISAFLLNCEWGSSSLLSKLKNLNLSRATGVRAKGFKMIVNAFTALESVDVSYSWGFGDREAAALSVATELREVSMDKCMSVTDVGLAKIAIRCGKLEKLSLKWCMEISDLGVDLLCKKCRELKSLDLSYIKVTNESLCSISSLPKLEILIMAGCSLIDDTGLKFLENACPLLQVIDVSRCELVSSSGLISLIRGHPALVQFKASHCVSEPSAALLQRITHLKNLETFVINGTRVSDHSLETIGRNCNSLVEVGLSKCIDITDTGIMNLVSGCNNLRIVNLTCCQSITDLAISAIVKSCRNLICLKLESCNMITEKGLHQIGSFCMQLKELDLTDCCGVNDRGLESLSRCVTLSHLKLGLCTNISDKGLRHIGLRCTNLVELDLYRCTEFGDDGLAALASGCKKLSKLILSYCDELTDKGMKHVSLLEELSWFELRGLKNVTGSGLASVAIGCRKLAYLDLKLCEKIDDSGFWAVAYFLRNLRQLTLSYCAVSDMALRMMMGNLTRLQDVDLVHLSNVSVEGFELALRACSTQIKKVKLLAPLRFLLSSEVLETLNTKGCKIRWD